MRLLAFKMKGRDSAKGYGQALETGKIKNRSYPESTRRKAALCSSKFWPDETQVRYLTYRT